MSYSAMKYVIAIPEVNNTDSAALISHKKANISANHNTRRLPLSADLLSAVSASLPARRTLI